MEQRAEPWVSGERRGLPVSMHQLDALGAHGAVGHQYVAAGGAGAGTGWAQLIQTR